MDTKWKNRILIIAWFLLFTFGLNGLCLLLFHGNDYFGQSFTFQIVMLAGIIALLFSLYWLKRLSVIRIIENEKWQSFYNCIPMDVAIVVLFIFGIISLTLLQDAGWIYSSYFNVVPSFIESLIYEAVFVALTMVQANLLWSRYKHMENPADERRKTLVMRFINSLDSTLLIRSTGIQMLVLLVIIFFTGFGVPIVLQQMGYYGSSGELIFPYIVLFLIITLPALIVLAKRIGYLNLIIKNVNNLVKGYLEPDLPVKGWKVLRNLAANINTLKHGVTVSQEKQAKSERLKTELITNVSHDLRTPLTSIITYTELLKTPELTEDERTTYIEVIDRKSKRLKVLIEDLFEASKMASGAVELVKEKVDIVQLLQQSLAENDERINDSTLQFRVSKPDHPIYAIVDGQKLWRVFDNLIGNILKYSLENTRVYITLNKSGDQIIIAFKNITKYELSENLDELFERFKRGDTSRHTEGSGLGLAIAKSIVDLHEGTLDIDVDGDLFKVTVTLQAI